MRHAIFSLAQESTNSVEPRHAEGGADNGAASRAGPRYQAPALGENNFDLLRVLFATTVCLVHSFELSGYQELAWIGQIFSSVVAVKAFFVVSGFFIFMSYERSASLASYSEKRVRRIYPAYFTIIMVCAFSLAGQSTLQLSEYFSADWLGYVLANLVFLNFLHPTLPGVFENNPAAAVNGALWTLKIEVLFYLAVPIFALLLRRLPRLPVILAIYAASIAFREGMIWLANETGRELFSELGRQLPGQLAYFIAGAAIYYFLDFFRSHFKPLLAGSIFFLTVHTFYSPMTWLEPAALAIVVCGAGLFFYLGHFGKYGDFSYGIYIVHFPIIQSLIATHWFDSRPLAFLATTVLLTIFSAFILWNLIEKHFLSAKTRTLRMGQVPPQARPAMLD